MKISQIEQEQSQVVLNIQVDPPELEEHLNGAYRQVVQRTNIPGFRKGKAPRSVVERYVGRDALLEQALDSLMPSVTSRAILEQNLDVVATPRVRLAQQDPLTIEATVAIRPPVELGDYRQIRLDVEEVEVTQEEVDQRIESLRQEMGTWEPVESPLEMDDMVTMEVRGVVDGGTVVDEKGVDYVLYADSSSPLPGFGEKLVGAARGDRRDFSLPVPEEYPDADMAGKECDFTVTVEEVKERKLPEMDDEFARSLNMEVETLADLRKKLEDDLHRQAQVAADRRFEEQVVQALIEGAQVELPPLMVEDEVEHIMSDQAEALRRQQLSMEAYLSTVGKSAEELHAELHPIAEKQLTRSLVLQEVARREGIEVSPQDLEAEMTSLGGGSNPGQGSLMQVLGSEEGRMTISRVLVTRRTLELLARIVKGEAEEAVSSPPEETPAPEGQGEQEGGE